MFLFDKDIEFDESENFLLNGAGNGDMSVFGGDNNDVDNDKLVDDFVPIELLDEAEHIGFNKRICYGILSIFRVVTSSRVCRTILKDVLGRSVIRTILGMARINNPTAYNKLIMTFMAIQEKIEPDIDAIIKNLSLVEKVMTHGWITIVYILMKYPELIVQILKIVAETDSLYNIVHAMLEKKWFKGRVMEVLEQPITIQHDSAQGDKKITLLQLICNIIQTIGKYAGMILTEELRTAIGDRMGVYDWESVTINDVFKSLDMKKFNNIVNTNPFLIVISISLFFPLKALMSDFKHKRFNANMCVVKKNEVTRTMNGGESTSILVFYIGLAAAVLITTIVVLIAMYRENKILVSSDTSVGTN